MKLTLNIKKSVEQNAETYFEAAKKAKKKAEGAKEALAASYEKLEKLKIKAMEIEEEAKEGLEKEKEKKAKKEILKAQQKWFHKFHWFISSDEFLVVGGRDATTNEILVKKHMNKNDLVFHTELAGSPFVIIKNPENKKIPEATINQAAECCASFSRSWKLGRGTAEVYYITPEQVKKESGLPKGSFMIHGKRNYIEAEMKLAITQTKEGIMIGPPNAVEKQAIGKIIYIEQGSEKTSDAAKEIRKIIGGELDDIIRMLPQGVKIRN